MYCDMKNKFYVIGNFLKVRNQSGGWILVLPGWEDGLKSILFKPRDTSRPVRVRHASPL